MSCLSQLSRLHKISKVYKITGKETETNTTIEIGLCIYSQGSSVVLLILLHVHGRTSFTDDIPAAAAAEVPWPAKWTGPTTVIDRSQP